MSRRRRNKKVRSERENINFIEAEILKEKKRLRLEEKKKKDNKKNKKKCC